MSQNATISVPKGRAQDVIGVLRAAGYAGFNVDRTRLGDFVRVDSVPNLVEFPYGMVPSGWLKVVYGPFGEPVLQNLFSPCTDGMSPVRVGGRHENGCPFYAWADGNRPLAGQFPDAQCVGRLG